MGTGRSIGAIGIFPAHYEFVRLPGQKIPEREIFSHIKGHRSMPFYDVFQILDPEYMRGHTLAAKRVKDTESARYVDQRDYAITSAGRDYTKLRTLDLRSCFALSLHDPLTRVGLLAHFDERTIFFDSFQEMIHDLRKEHDVPPEDLTATLIGSGKCHSTKLLVNLFIHLQRSGIRAPKIIMGPDYVCHAMLDVATGEVSLIDRVEADPEFIADVDIKFLTPLDRSYWNT